MAIVQGEQIPLMARLMALVSERPYKRPFSHDDALQIIVEGKGTQFEPILVDVFLSVADQI